MDTFVLSHHNGHHLHFGKADWFHACSSCTPKAIYAGIYTLRPIPLTESERIAQPWANPTHTFRHGYVKLKEGTELTRSLQNFYFPGGFYIEFIEKPDVWLVKFKAEDILASAYMLLSKEEIGVLMLGIDRLAGC